VQDAERRVTRLLPDDVNWDALLPGLRRTYRRARGAYSKAKARRKPEAFHAFRTPEKRHLYQVKLLESLWPDALSSRLDELDKLGELLGDHHDLSLLESALSAARGSEREKERIQVLIARRMKQLERKSLRLGALLFAPKPKIFCQGLRRADAD
jgi:CHAD domain-containing protein